MGVTTTQRPPFLPESFGHLAGRGFEPARLTAMHHRHLALGARMMPAGLWYRPAYYGAPADREAAIAAEVRAVRTGVGMIDVSTLGGLEVRGPDAAELLERIYTFAYAKQPVGRTRYLLACDMTGAIIDDGVACRFAEDWFYVTATTSGVDVLYRSMLRWNAEWRLDVDVAGVTAAYAGINLAGPLARQVLERLDGDIDLAPTAFPYLACRQGRLAGIPVRMLRVGFVGELGYEIHCPASYGAALWDLLAEAGKPLGHPPLRRRGPARPAPGEGPHHRRPGHGRPDLPAGSRHGVGDRRQEAVLRRPACDRGPGGTAPDPQARGLHPALERSAAGGMLPGHPRRCHRRPGHLGRPLRRRERDRGPGLCPPRRCGGGLDASPSSWRTAAPSRPPWRPLPFYDPGNARQEL